MHLILFYTASLGILLDLAHSFPHRYQNVTEARVKSGFDPLEAFDRESHVLKASKASTLDRRPIGKVDVDAPVCVRYTRFLQSDIVRLLLRL